MLVPPNQFLGWALSTSDQDFVSFQPILCHPHTQIRIILFHDEQSDIPNLEFSPIHVSIGFSQIAFPITVLPKDDHTDFAQEEQPGLQYWTMIKAICVVVDESKCLDTPTLESLLICEHLPFLLGYKPILRLLLVHRNRGIWRWYLSMILAAVHLRCWRSLFSEYCVRTWIVFCNITSGYNSTFVLSVLCLKLSIFQVTCVH